MKILKFILIAAVVAIILLSIACVANNNYPVANWYLLETLFLMKIYEWLFMGGRAKNGGH